MTWPRVIVVVGVLATLVALLLPFGRVTVYDGHFDLTVVLPTGTTDRNEPKFAICWSELEAEHAIQYGSKGEIPFQFGHAGDPHRRSLSVPFSGKINALGNETSYNEPKFVVVEYAIGGPEVKLQRMKVALPSGRGSRSIQLPFLIAS